MKLSFNPLKFGSVCNIDATKKFEKLVEFQSP